MENNTAREAQERFETIRRIRQRPFKLERLGAELADMVLAYWGKLHPSVFNPKELAILAKSREFKAAQEGK